MSFQYIYTSSKRGLEPGKSGFCCVARDRDTPPDLIQELDRLSRYQALSTREAPRILRHRIASLRSGDYHILSHICECGSDYSKRNNHLAHHLAFSPDELAGLPNPASILLNWKGWRVEWDEPPRVLAESDAFDIRKLDTHRYSSNAPKSYPDPFLNGKIARQAFRIELSEDRPFIEHLRLFLNHLPISDQWSYSFTNCLLPTDQPQDYVWCGVASPKELPFEIDFLPHPISIPTEPIDNPPPPSPPPSVSTPPPPAARPNPYKSAPTVEIPEAYDRRKRKRPRRKFGMREFSRSINLAIALSAILCAAIVAYIYQSYRGSDALPNHSPGSLDPASEREVLLLRWRAFERDGYPQEQLASARQTALALDALGLAPPADIVAFLDELSEPSATTPDRRLRVPKSLIQTDATGFRLPLSPDSYPALRRLALLPEQLVAGLQNLSRAATGESSPWRFLDSDSYSPDQLATTLRQDIREAEAALQSVPAPARLAIESYRQEQSSVLKNSQFAPYIALPSVFGFPARDAYIAFDDTGILLPDSPTSFASYLQELFVRAAAAEPRPSESLRAAIDHVRNQNLKTAYETALVVYQAVEIAALDSPQRWLPVRQAWELAFIREDLMEQTIVSYTLEALERSKIELLELRSRFSRDELERSVALDELRHQTAQFINAAHRVAGNEDWVVIDKQTFNVAADYP